MWATSFLVQAAGVCASCGCSADQSRPALPLPTAQKRSTKYLLFSLERCLGTRRGRSRNSSLRLCQELESRHDREGVQHQESRARTDSTREKTLAGHTRDNNGVHFGGHCPSCSVGDYTIAWRCSPQPPSLPSINCRSKLCVHFALLAANPGANR